MSYTRIAPLALAAIVLVFILILAATGCGSSTKSSSQTTSSAQTESSSHAATAPATPGRPLTNTELIAKANFICKGILAKLNAGSFKSRRDLERIAPPLAAYEMTALHELNTLTPPATLAGPYSQVIASIRILAENTGKMAQALTTKSASLERAVHQLVATNYQIRAPMLATAAHAGFTECAQVQ